MLFHSVLGAGGTLGGAEGWNISTTTYVQNFSVSAQDTTPVDVFFTPDGTKMFLLGRTGDDVNEYDLSIAWDVSTAAYSQNFSISAQETSACGLFFKPDGTKMYVIGFAGDDVNEYSLSTAWDVSTSSYTQRFSVSAQDTAPLNLFFKPDGIKMYVVGNAGNDINEYSLSTAWDVSTASYLQNFSVSAQDGVPFGLFFKPDGTKMYVVGNEGNDVNEYDLSTAWDVSTASYYQNVNLVAQDYNWRGIFFKSDGTKMYLVGGIGLDINEYDVSN